jgi:hypothetical protein
LNCSDVNERNEERRRWVYKQEDEVKKEKKIREQIKLLSPYHGPVPVFRKASPHKS